MEGLIAVYMSSRKLQEDLAFREQMFQEMQQAKDNEILRIKQMKRDVEMRLENVLDPDKGDVCVCIILFAMLDVVIAQGVKTLTKMWIVSPAIWYYPI